MILRLQDGMTLPLRFGLFRIHNIRLKRSVVMQRYAQILALASATIDIDAAFSLKVQLNTILTGGDATSPHLELQGQTEFCEQTSAHTL